MPGPAHVEVPSLGLVGQRRRQATWSNIGQAPCRRHSGRPGGGSAPARSQGSRTSGACRCPAAWTPCSRGPW
eukprot:2866859-Pyramimonas_sp.AAC.1